MYADLSRDSYRPGRHYTAVLAQQGRVQLDADVNEQAAIQTGLLRTLAADLIGPAGGPAGAAGFAITHLPGADGTPDDLTIAGGRYYVDGIPADATRPVPGVPVPDEGAPPEPDDPEPWTYRTQPDGRPDPLPAEFPYLAYLRVWETSVTAVEDPGLREVALGPAVPDTAARIRVAWQVRAVTGDELGLSGTPEPEAVRAALADWAGRDDEPRMAARARRPDDADDDPALLAPDARYRGPENQLYRVEIHRGGPAAQASLKWSRENGSVVLGVADVDGARVELTSLGADDKLDLHAGEWVEAAGRLLRIEELDPVTRRLRLSGEPTDAPYLRRWDHTGGTRDGAVPLEEGRWLPLEDGVEIYFAAGDFAYNPGDYWLIPARTITGDVEWPRDPAGRPLLTEPAGIVTHHAPLAWITAPGEHTDLRLTFRPLVGEAAPAPRPAARRRARKSQ